MSKNTVLKLGLFGFGCVGQGLHNVLSKTNGINASIEKICIKHPNKSRSLPSDYFTTDAKEILENPNIDVVVELIDDPIAAYAIVKTALSKGKAVVSANKKLIAEHLDEFLELQRLYKTPLLYEGSVCGSIPIIRNLEEYYDNDLLGSISGIFNGSTNYILSKMRNEGWNFDQALRVAQEKGFAESNPFLDVSGLDAKYKLCIALMHAFGVWIRPDDMLNIGIDRLNEQDFVYAQQNDKIIKLVVHGQRQDDSVIGFVMPTLISKDNPLANVHDEYNGVLLESAFSNQQFFGGKGAGSDPTGSAVLSDISALTYNYRYEYKKLQQSIQYREGKRQLLEVYVRYRAKSDVNWDDFESIHQRFESREYNYVLGSIFLEKLHGETWQKNNHISVVLNALASAQSVGITPTLSASAAPKL
jgi:homoserine dehydrogenase